VDINKGAEDSSPFGLTEYKGKLYFTAETGETGSELFRLASHWSRPVAIDINEGPEDSTPNDYFVL
jgi:ELWxxDGT repeat protein